MKIIQIYTSQGWLSKLSSFSVWGSHRSNYVVLRGQVLPLSSLKNGDSQYVEEEEREERMYHWSGS